MIEDILAILRHVEFVGSGCKFTFQTNENNIVSLVISHDETDALLEQKGIVDIADLIGEEGTLRSEDGRVTSVQFKRPNTKKNDTKEIDGFIHAINFVEGDFFHLIIRYDNGIHAHLIIMNKKEIQKLLEPIGTTNVFALSQMSIRVTLKSGEYDSFRINPN